MLDNIKYIFILAITGVFLFFAFNYVVTVQEDSQEDAEIAENLEGTQVNVDPEGDSEEVLNTIGESESMLNNNSANNPQTEEESQVPQSGPQPAAKTYNSAPPMQLEEGKNYRAVIQTSKGEINIDLFETKVPVTVNNFVFLANEGYYSGTKFHRIIKGFMIQGGDPTGTGAGSPGYRFEDEPFDGEYSAGTIAMANSGPNTNGSQFFIMHEDYALPKDYVIFGKVISESDMAVVDKIANVPVTRSSSGENSKPLEEVLVNSIRIIAQ